MRLFPIVNGSVDQTDGILMPPFDVPTGAIRVVCFEAVEVFAVGAAQTEIFAIGPEASEIFAAGAEKVELFQVGADASEAFGLGAEATEVGC
jgi:hypothetical protein